MSKNNDLKNKKPRKNKNHLFQTTIRTKQTLTLNQSDILNDMIILFNQQKRHWFNFSLKKKGNRTNFIKTQQQFNNGILPYNYRFFQGIKQEIQGMVESIKSNNRNYLVDKEAKLKHVNQKIKKASTKYKNSVKNKITLNLTQNDLDKSLFYLQQRYKKKQRLENQIKNLKEKQPTICFGGKKLLKERNKCQLEEQILDWKKRWFEARHNQLLLVGSHDETQGNMNCQLRYDIQTDVFSMEIKIPYILQTKYNQVSMTIENVIIPDKYREMMKYEVLKHQNKESNRESLSFRFIKHNDNQYYCHIGLNQEKKPIVTSNYHGLIGVDINPDHLAVVEIDSKGNFLKQVMLPMELENKNQRQRKDIISNTLLTLKDIALQTGKSIVIEKLNFKNKKRALSDNKNKEYAIMLSSFAYQHIIQGIKYNGYKYGIEVKEVNPAYTSILGEIKYSTELGLSIHMSAAYVIARRGYEYKEKLNKLFHTTRKGEVFTLLVPEGKQAISQFTRWYRGEFRKVKDITKLANFVGKYVPHNQLIGCSDSERIKIT